MPRWVRYSLLPAAIAFAAFFAVLPRTGTGPTIKIVGSSDAPRFDTSVASVPVGTRLAFENDTKATQTATCANCGSKGWDTGDIQPGQTVFVTVDKPGDDQYVSNYDPGLVGRLLVGVEAAPSPSASA